jgi:hypothetical protein
MCLRVKALELEGGRRPRPDETGRVDPRVTIPDRGRRALDLVALATTLAATGCSATVGCSNAGIEALERRASPAGEIAKGAKYAGWIAAAPLDLAAVPVAGAVWASPWGDLPLFADVLTAPSVGVGYVFEAILGAPGSLLALGLEDDDTAPVASPDACVPWGFVVEHRPPAPNPRPARPLSPEVVSYYAVPEGAAQRLGRELDAAARAPDRDDDEPLSIELAPFGFEGTLEVSLAEGDDPRPLVLLTPPSQATFAARYLARRYARRGIHSAVIVPRGDYLDPWLDAAALEAKLRGALVAARTAVQALASRPEVSRVVYLGISAGGIFGALLLAVEPRVERAALVFPGGDLATIAATSTEDTVRAFRESWQVRGVAPEALRRLLAATLRTEPLRLAPSIDTPKVLFFLADSDTMVPLPCGLALRKALGEPETWVLSGEHEEAGSCFGFVLREADEFLLAR